MALPRIKSTYSLDPETVEMIERMAARWGTSRSDVLRRVVRAAAEAPDEDADRALAALNRLQRAARLSATRADGWVRRVRSERKASRVPPEAGHR
jgi:Arc/MetJ-type ribon-helix-helix transcriptional regulator